MKPKITYEMIRDEPEAVGKILAEVEPGWPVGSAHGYHANTFGLYVEQLVMRVDPNKRRLHEFFKEEIAEPFGKFCVCLLCISFFLSTDSNMDNKLLNIHVCVRD